MFKDNDAYAARVGEACRPWGNEDQAMERPASAIRQSIDTHASATKLAGSVCDLVDRLIGPAPSLSGSAIPKPAINGIFPELADAASNTRGSLADAFEALARLERALS